MRLTSLCLAAETPRVGGTFGFKFSSRPHPRKFGLKRFLAVRKVLAGKWVACFWATSLEKLPEAWLCSSRSA